MRKRDELDHDECDCTADTPMEQLCSHHKHWRKFDEREAAAEAAEAQEADANNEQFRRGTI